MKASMAAVSNLMCPPTRMKVIARSWHILHKVVRDTPSRSHTALAVMRFSDIPTPFWPFPGVGVNAPKNGLTR